MGVKPSASAQRVARILNFLATGGTSFSLSEIARELAIHKATCSTVLLALVEVGYVRRDEETRLYCLGPAVISIGEAALAGMRIVDYAHPELEALSAELSLQSIAIVAAGAEMIVVARAGHVEPFGGNVRVGQTVPLVPPFGTAFLAWSSPETIEDWLLRGANLDDTERRHYRSVLAAVRSRGYSVTLVPQSIGSIGSVGSALEKLANDPASAEARVERDQLIRDLGHAEYSLVEVKPFKHYRVGQIAAPVFDANGDVALVIQTTGVLSEIDAEEIPIYAERVCAAARRITQQVHGRPPNS